MPETPDETIEYPAYREEPWYENGTVDPETGEEQTTDGYVDHLEQLEVRAPIVVESWSDLPTNDLERVDHKTGQARQRYVLEHDLLVYDDGQEWRALGGLGSEDRPLPEQHVESLHAGSAEVAGVRKELVHQDSFSGEFSFTFSYERDTNVSYEIRVVGLMCSDGDEVVDLQFQSFSSGDYSYATKDATGGQTSYENQDQFRLLSNEIGGNNGMAGLFSLSEGRGRPIITPVRAADYQGNFEYLFRPQSTNSNPRPDPATVSGKVSNATITIQRIVDMP